MKEKWGATCISEKRPKQKEEKMKRLKIFAVENDDPTGTQRKAAVLPAGYDRNLPCLLS